MQHKHIIHGEVNNVGNYLTKEEALFERDETGELLPVDLPLKMLEKKDKDGKIIKEAPVVKFIPIPRGKWVKMATTMKRDEQDKIILTEHLIEPKVTAEEYDKAGKPMVFTAISNAVSTHTLDQAEEIEDESEQKN